MPRLVFRRVFLVASGNLRFAGRLDIAERFLAEADVADRPAFGPQVIGAMAGVEGVQLLGTGIRLGGISIARQNGDSALAVFLEQPRILLRQALGHGGGVIRRNQQLSCVKAGSDVAANHVFAQAALTQHREKGVAVELAVNPLERRNLHQFAVDQAFAGTQAVLVSVFRQRRALDHLVQHSVHSTAGDEPFHRQGRILLLFALERGGHRLRQVRGADLALADRGHAVAAGNAAERVGADQIAAGESDGDHDQEHERDAHAELGLEEVAEELEHRGLSCGDRPRAISPLRRARNTSPPLSPAGQMAL